MNPTESLIRLATMFSPAFPVGAFAYSGGLERAAADGIVADAGSLAAWLKSALGHGAARNDAILFAEAFRRGRDGADARDLHELALALAGSAERHGEAAGQGAAFGAAASVWKAEPDEPPRAYAVAAGETAGRTGAALADALALFLTAWAGNLVHVAIRLSVVGQSGGVAVLAAMESTLAETAQMAERSSPDDLGGCAVVAEIAAMRHETMQTRLFRS